MDTKKESKNLTNEVGTPVENNTNSLTSGERGPVAMQDTWLMEKLAHFDREVIPERRMHAKGSGAYGTLTITEDISRYTKASVLQPNEKTDMFIRFSTVAGERGAADTTRDIRGVAMKFYTKEGNWDLVGNNTPVFFLRDPLQFPDLNHVVKRNPQTNMHSAQDNWDFWTCLPEALHQVTITMSDRGIPASYRNMHLYGSHTYSLINAEGMRTWVKFHFRTRQGIKCVTNDEAAKIRATNLDKNQEDLFEHIEKKDYPRWDFYIQTMTEDQAQHYKENPFDITKVWSQKDFPLIKVGVLELNRNPENYFAEVEQAAFNPAHIVPGIGFSPDKLLQGRLFSYGDAQRYRLGINADQIPVNRAHVPVHSYHRDGFMRVDGNGGAGKSYTPNSYGEYAEQPDAFQQERIALNGILDRYEPKEDQSDDCFYQPGDLYRLMNEDQKQQLISNTAEDMAPVTENIKYRHAAHCFLADPHYGKRLSDALGLDYDKVKELSKLSHAELMKATASK